MKKNFTKSIYFLLPLLIVLMVLPNTGFSQNLQISGGNNFSAAVCDNQEVFVWGANASGQLAIDASDAPIAASYSGVPLGVTRGNVSNVAGGLTYGALPAISQVDAGSGAHVLGLSCAGQVWAWGDNSQGQLGRNNLVNSPVPQRVLRGAQASKIDPVNDPNGIFLHDIFYVSGGNNSSFALEKTTGKVLSWGQNGNGELGDGTSTQQSLPVYVIKSAADGGGQLTGIIQIEGGDDCTYALDGNGNVWSWGDNTGNKLGRLPTATAIVPTASRVIQGDPNNNGYSTTPTPTVYLSGIIQISGGDTHCLCLDANGNVWSFGGDWGSGQLGRGGGAVYQDDARKVSNVGLTTYATANNQFLGNGADGKAVYVAAGQASSAVVMASGRVVTFGARGLYNAGSTPTGSGTAIACPTPAGDMIMSGTLGDGNAGCNSTVCSGKASATQWSVTPVYVMSGGLPLSNITQVSDGDAWYYALSKTGSAYVWGWNRRGELGLGAGDYTDRCSAVAFTLPTGCAFSNPCPKQPVLPANFTSCPIFSAVLDPQVAKTYSTYQYNWQYRATAGSGTWSDVVGTTSGTLKQTILTSKDSLTKTVAQLGEWRVLISDNRSSVPFLCGPCPVLKDSVTISPIANPYTFGGCIGTTSSSYAVTAPATAKIKWYTSYTGGSALNPLDSNTAITVLNSVPTATAACGGGLALYAEDKGSSVGTLFPTGSLTPTAAQIATAVGCATGSWTSTAGTDSYLAFTVAKTVTLTSVSLYLNNTTTNPVTIATGSINIYNNKPAALWNGSYNVDTYNATSQIAGFPISFTAGPIPAATSLVKSVSFPASTVLAPGTYWISAKGDYNIQPYFGCNPTNAAAYPGNWTTPIWDNTGNTIKAVAAISPANSNGYSSKGSIFDLKFTTGTGYNCGRILVCQSSTACPLPIELMTFNATKEANSVVLDWSTASEKNSAYFDVQRSFDGINFQAIGRVQAAGNSNSIHQYSFVDESGATPGLVYYRLMEYDIDGITSGSETKTIRNSSQNDVTVVPNPSNGNFKVFVEGDNSTVGLIIYNALGQIVYQLTDRNNNDGTYSKNIDIQNLPAGVYILHVNTPGQSWTKKIIKE